jgi:hypothetical protein
MRGQIVWTKIRFRFHDPAHPLNATRYMNQAFPEQFPGDQNRVAIVKCAR